MPDTKKWYSSKEAASLIEDVFETSLGEKYWVKFIYNHSRGVRGLRDEARWMHIETHSDNSGKIRISENELQRFIDEGSHYVFPLKYHPSGYARKSITQIKNKNSGYMRVIGDEKPVATTIATNAPETVTFDKQVFDQKQFNHVVKAATKKDECIINLEDNSVLVRFEGCEFTITKENFDRFDKIYTFCSNAQSWNQH